jgi:serine/threonine protein kinase
MDLIQKAETSGLLSEVCPRLNVFPTLHKPSFKRKSELPSIISSRLNSEGYHNMRVLNNEGTDLNPVFEIVKKIYVEEMAATEVLLLRHVHLDELFILKRIIKQKLLQPEHWESASRELQIHSQLSHPNIVDNIDTGETSTYFMELLEFVPRSNYFVEKVEINNTPFMTKRDGGIQKLKSFCFDILQGLKFLHSVNIIHMDIKPANLLLSTKVTEDEYSIVKICDFGLSKIADIEGKTLILHRCGTEPYIAPEVQTGRMVTCAVDMWSFGIFLYIVTVGYSPITLKWKPGNKLPAYARHWKKYEGTGLFDLIDNCLKFDPGERITAEQALNHQWLRCRS